jgi:hypothetical protein
MRAVETTTSHFAEVGEENGFKPTQYAPFAPESEAKGWH